MQVTPSNHVTCHMLVSSSLSVSALPLRSAYHSLKKPRMHDDRPQYAASEHNSQSTCPTTQHWARHHVPHSAVVGTSLLDLLLLVSRYPPLAKVQKCPPGALTTDAATTIPHPATQCPHPIVPLQHSASSTMPATEPTTSTGPHTSHRSCRLLGADGRWVSVGRCMRISPRGGYASVLARD